MKTIGVLGGLGPQATMDFEARLHRVSQQIIPQQAGGGYPPLLVYYFREPPVIMPADGSMPTSLPPVNPRLLDAAKKLGALVDFLVITANGPHHFQREIEAAAGREVLSMIDATVDEVRRRGARKVGLVDFRPSRVGVYGPRLDAIGVAWEETPPGLLAPLTRAVFAIDEGAPGSEVGQPAREALDHLRSKGADTVILACTEIPFMLPEALGDPDVVNPAQLLAEAAVRHALS